MAESNRKQAFIPEGSIPIENPKGTAPGFIVEGPNGSIISIPGVPLEMEYLMNSAVLPYLRRRFRLEGQVIRYRVLRACGLGESAIGHQIQDLMKQGQNPSVGTLASIGDIKIRITARADGQKEASLMIQEMEENIRNRLGILIYGVDEETLHGNVARELERLNLTLSVVETVTGGNLSQKLTSTGSPSFVEGIVLPSEGSQRRFLDLSAKEFNTLLNAPAWFTDSLALMAKSEFKTDFGLALFGQIIEEQGKAEFGTETWYSLTTPSGMENQKYSLGGELAMVRERASIIGLDMLRKYLLKTAQSA